MITEEAVRSIIEEKIEGTDKFIVSVKVHSGNKIMVFVDSDTNITITDCMEISRSINNSFDREEEDFELNVSTAGADMPFGNIRQYRKNIGRNVKTKLIDDTVIEGELKEVEEGKFLVVTREKARIEGRKVKQWVETEHWLKYNNIVETKVIITF